MIAAILRAQLLSMRPRSSRNAGLGIVVGTIWYGFWCFVACWAGFAAAFTGADTLRYALPIGLLAICVYWQAIPVLSASMGSALDLRKLLVYPVPHQKLFLVEVLLRLTTGAEMVVVLIGGSVGLLWNHASRSWLSPPRILSASLVFVVFNLLLASGTRSLLERLLSRRKVRELVALAMAMLWMGPRLMMMSGVKPRWFRSAGAAVGTFGLPWAAAARALFPVGESAVWLSWLSLAAWTAAAYWFGRAQFERNIRYDILAAQATQAGPVSAGSIARREWFYRLPGVLWRDPLAAIVEKELRSLMRSPRFRMVFVMGVSFGLMLWLPLAMGRRGGGASSLSRHFLPIVCVYSMTMLGQVTFWNCFGLDRSAAVFYFASPQPLSRVLMGKNIACLFFVYIETLVLTCVGLAVRVKFGLAEMLETWVVVGICAIYLMALGNISSVRYPRVMSPERVAQSGGGSKGQVLVMFLYPLVLLPVILAYIARYAFGSQVAFVVVLALAAAIGAVVYWLAMDSAVASAGLLRQNILEELSRGDGPVAS